MKAKGFNLIELMITLAILGVTAAVAYPAYQGYSTTSKRTEAKVELAKIAMAQERFFTNNNAYAQKLADLPGYSTDPVKTENDYYEISIANNATGFTLTATAQFKDTCKSLTLTSTGTRGSNPSNEKCW